MNYDHQRAKSHILYSPVVAFIDGRTAADGYRREMRFDRDLGDWVVGKQHTVPRIFSLSVITYRLCQN